MSAGVQSRSTSSSETVSKCPFASGCFLSAGPSVSVSHRSTSSSIGVLISLVSDIPLAIILAGLEGSILVEQNSTVNAGKQLTLFRLGGRERGCDGSHNRATRAGTRDAWLSSRELAGSRQGKNSLPNERSHLLIR